MKNFEQRYVAPAWNDKYYLKTTHGGLNECIQIQQNGSVLANCVGYCWGRAFEYTNERPKLSKANAENWYGYTQDGYKRSKTPKVGSIACWYGPGELCGHVAFVEQVNKDNSIVLTESNYGGIRWRRYTIAYPYYQYGLQFQGFIILPQKTISKKGATEFCTQLYKGLFNRKPDTEGLNSWVNKLVNRKASPSDVVVGFFNSKEYLKKGRSDNDFVEDCYKAILGRASDKQGKKHWLETLKKGGSRFTIINGFCNSHEFRKKCEELGIL